MKQIFKTKEGEFDFTNKKVRLNGKVLDKFSLCAAMERLDYKKFQYTTLYTYDICTYEEIKNELHEYLVVWDEVETAKQQKENEYENLWNEFAKDWKFSTMANIGGFVLYRSHNTFCLATYKEDKRQYNNYRMDCVFKTESYDEMREYLIANNPTQPKAEQNPPKYEVYFEVCDFDEVVIYCRDHNINKPNIYNCEGTNNYYKSTYDVWEMLYQNLPHNVMGCYRI